MSVVEEDEDQEVGESSLVLADRRQNQFTRVSPSDRLFLSKPSPLYLMLCYPMRKRQSLPIPNFNTYSSWYRAQWQLLSQKLATEPWEAKASYSVIGAHRLKSGVSGDNSSFFPFVCGEWLVCKWNRLHPQSICGVFASTILRYGMMEVKLRSFSAATQQVYLLELPPA
jgi:hypothetical protein